MTAELVTALDVNRARYLTDRIKTGVETIWELITEAYTSRADLALGYQSWDDYCANEFGTARLLLPREERREVMPSMREIGMSNRAIAAATGVDERTVRRELAGAASAAPDPDEDALAEELIATAPPITGRDGKTYPPPRPKPQPTPEQIRAEQERRARSHTFTRIAEAMLTAGSWGGYDDIGAVMTDYNPDELDPPELDRYLTVEHLQKAKRFVNELIKWRRHAG